jgi:hypothetical protein
MDHDKTKYICHYFLLFFIPPPANHIMILKLLKAEGPAHHTYFASSCNENPGERKRGHFCPAAHLLGSATYQTSKLANDMRRGFAGSKYHN